MSDVNDDQIIQCPFCKTPITVEKLSEHVNANPETKKQAIEEELQPWDEAYERNYLIQNVVFCPSCGKVSHYKDWTSDSNSNSNKKKLKIIAILE
jgi:uncharacterized protein (DUF2225 family)